MRLPRASILAAQARYSWPRRFSSWYAGFAHPREGRRGSAALEDFSGREMSLFGVEALRKHITQRGDKYQRRRALRAAAPAMPT